MTIALQKSCNKPANRRAASDEKPTPGAYRWSRIKTGYLHIWDFYYIFINHKFIPFAITHRTSKLLEHRNNPTIAKMDIACFDL